MTYSLIYHDVAPPGDHDHCGFPGPAAARDKLTPETFEVHLDSIEAAHVEVGLAVDHPQAALTFDDGASSAPWVADALELRGWRGDYFITRGASGRQDSSGQRDPRPCAP